MDVRMDCNVTVDFTTQALPSFDPSTEPGASHAPTMAANWLGLVVMVSAGSDTQLLVKRPAVFVCCGFPR